MVGTPDRAALDTVWIPIVAEAGWLIITRDSRIQHRRAETTAVRDAGAKMIALGVNDARGTWQQLEVLLTQCPAINKLTTTTGPFIFSATGSGLRKISLK